MNFGFKSVIAGSVVVMALLVGALIWGARSGPGVGNGKAPIRIYCAAGIRKPVEAIAREYEKKYGVSFETNFKGSGALLADIRAGDTGDLYLAADVSYMDEAQEKSDPEVAPVAYQRPVIAVRADNEKNVKSIEDLLRDDVRVSLADPKVAAISKTSKKMLMGTKHKDGEIWDAIYESKIVARDTVNAVANDIKAKTTDAGIVWDATAQQYPELKIIRVPQFEKKPKNISIAVLNSSEQPTRALHFIRFLTSRDHGMKQFKKFGYDAIDGDKWAERPELVVYTGGLMHPAIKDTITEFEEREGVTVLSTPDGCGVLVARIKGGATPDLYFSCDITFMEKVEEIFPESLNVAGTEMVIVVNKQNQDRLKITKLEDLTNSKLKVGLCSPEHSALGALTKNLLDKNGLWAGVEPNVKDWPSTADRLVEHVVFDSLDVAIVYRANTTRQADKLVVIDIDDPASQAVQPIAVAKSSDYKYLTQRLMDKIRGTKSKERFEELGFKWLGESAAP